MTNAHRAARVLLDILEIRHLEGAPEMVREVVAASFNDLLNIPELTVAEVALAALKMLEFELPKWPERESAVNLLRTRVEIWESTGD